MLGKALINAAAGNAAAGEGLYVEDVFSTYLYTGTGSAQTITNGIDLDGEGGAVWIKNRTNTSNHALFDTERGAEKLLFPDSTAAEDDRTADNDSLYPFNSDGFGLQADVGNRTNESGSDFVSWTFRKAPRFFDVVTYTGNGSSQNIAHNLGSVPGCIIVKDIDNTRAWSVYHTSLGNTQNLILPGTNAAATATDWNNTSPTDTQFTVGTNVRTNASGATYVAYLFAHNDGDGEFGESGDQDIIKCGSYTGNDSADGPVVNLGWEPQWLLIKESSASGNAWSLYDTMRNGTMDQHLRPNASDAEATAAASPEVLPQATGFKLNTSSGRVNRSQTYIYIAIRRGPMKTPESGTEVFSTATYTGDGSNTRQITSGFPVDMFISNRRTSPSNILVTRLLGAGDNTNHLTTSSTAAESDGVYTRLGMDYWQTGNGTVRWENTSGTDYVSWMFRRAPGFFDVVAYTGTGSSGLTVSHNLGVSPEMYIIKNRTQNYEWFTWHKELTDYGTILRMNENGAQQTNASFNTSPTSTSITINSTYVGINNSGINYLMYLFASVPGVSKVGSYTGNGSSQTINCGFSTGARFVLIKKSSGTGDWHVWDTERGIVSGNDPFLELNTSSAENTSYDSVDPDSSGFIVNEDAGTAINTSGGTYIYLAIA